MRYVPSRFARLVLVTGPAGSGRTTAINALEDLGYEAIDNLPLSLVPSVARPSELQKPLAIGLDCRNREFSPEGVLELLVTLCQTENLKTELLYLSCEPEVLLRRYSETRRRHPMAPEETPRIGIAKELLQLDVIRKSADVLLDTTSFSPHDLRREVSRWFSTKKTPNLTLGLESFSYKRGIPSGLDSIFDVRFLKNPHWDVALRNETGRSAIVQDFIRSDPRFEPFFQKTIDLIQFLLPAYVEEGKSHFAIGFGCTGGKHRSVAIAEITREALAHASVEVSIRHRELELKTA